MPVMKYDFVTGIETAAAPDAVPAAAPGDAFILGEQTSFTLADSQATTNVTSMVFSKVTYRAVWLMVTIFRSASGGSTRAQTGILQLITDGTNWEIGPMSMAAVPNTGDAGVTFTVTSAGQVQYATDANGGSYLAANSYLKWKILDLVAA